MSTADYVAKYNRRRALLTQVENYWIDEAYHTIIKEIDGLVLTKYLEETVAAVIEGASKGRGDPEIIVHLHKRLAPDFLPLLLPPLLAALAPAPPPAKDVSDKDREKEDKDRIARQRPILRIVAELAMLMAWPEGASKGAGEVGKILSRWMTNDPQFSNMPLLTSFLKTFGRAYLGPKPDKADEQLPEGVEELVPPEMQKKMRELFTNYFNSASKALVKGQTDKRNHEAYIRSGEIFEDRQHAYERMTRAIERLTGGVQGLSDLLGLPMPTLPTAASISKSGLQIVDSASTFTVREDGAVPGGIWDDDEERRFYENLPDLQDLVPPSILGIKQKTADEKKPENAEGEEGGEEAAPDAEEEAQRKVQDDIRRQLEQLELESSAAESETPQPMDRNETVLSNGSGPQDGSPDDDPQPASLEASLTEEDGMQSGPAARLTALFAALPEAVNREMVDKLAVEFAYLNSKAARRRLATFLAAVPKTRTDLLPHYARFIAILDPYMPDVGVAVLKSRKRAIRELDGVRLKNVRFYGELAKFKVARPYTILHVLKVFLDDFKFNIENISNLLETCGRFLLRNPDTAETSKNMSVTHLDQRYNIMLDNAFYIRVAREIEELPPMQAFIQHLLFDVLMKRTQDKVLVLLRKLHWEDAETFTDIWEAKYENIGLTAGLVHDLQRYHPDFAIAVVDQVMEDIRIGMEVSCLIAQPTDNQENIFKFNQRRIASIKFLGELYMYRVVNAAVIFDVLWSLLSFGHRLPVPGRDSPIDSVSDFFRVRLASALLDTCGICFGKGSLRRKLDQYLVVLQVNMPMDVEFMLDDLFDTLRPNGRPPKVKDGNQVLRMRSFPEAAAAVDELLASHVPGVEEDIADDESDEGEDGGRVAEEEEEAEEAPAEAADAASDGDDDSSSEAEEEEEDDVVVLREHKPDEFDEQAQADFDREFARMIADTTVDRKTAPPVFDQAVPVLRKRGQQQPAQEKPDDGQMPFMLMTKRGNKAQNEKRQENEDFEAIGHSMRARGIKVKVVPS
ncbi:hypothetical protein A1Q1_00107 [Trichosporon asahii var. asahii CBS 2479]|uniref:MIF4G domain-containing protein n=1 Tax=Trichosporon asahii var. asahii (strain ATCC 90039 / CBS 2479 / JCM 2466 / KCTC 7840 / NBRC 103889/ NCYC 2677 / UAMH 7654) TaxID=1186058 RepID=J8TZ93_TRIAS|nr:hypothetical protein A1Q1_00107 [Trichosporon asahii var. asahii CBS 2479]EJT53100.1 hypothetical protein A1Q1_00107 [Trichosporon asahii var. asahii CBS 2479]